MWSLLFCISSTSILSRAIAARTAFQRRSSSAVEIGVFSRSDRAIKSLPRDGLAHDVDHRLEIAGKKLLHIAGNGGHGAVLVAVRVAAEMREHGDVLGLVERTAGGQGLLRVDV